MIPGTIPTSSVVPVTNTDATGNSVVSLSARAATLNNVNSARLSDGGDIDLYEAFYQKLLSLPESASSETLKDIIYQEMSAFKDPKSGDSAFVSFEQQTAMLQNMLGKVESGSRLYEALNGVLVGTMNAQSQMTSWMQEVILSGGENKESIDW
ncbi:type III secretion system effector protein OrgC [Salmonella enterica]|uniref:Type III secretion system effector protein OrgC n=1 Tax=Salmonella enterica subsp. VII serovar 40:z4,z24:[z39] TaxID=1967625 RepID=A0A731TQP5_SALEE|nr:type III secretion system effector protein OrgC [Salmonella enterica]EDO5295132.1 type III secretion system effector protein OrgC [Salmonella enterica subsp. houtenae serovar 40:z4,z24:-]EDT6884727.1 type III secretion system effector protein OrgC [Salmonella enterica subsp. enterica]QUZ24442.1 type III secretion system effector protein OrgC [Salmonella enterica subsp. VII str. CFSAN000554]HAE4732635.1 type III secretion system effector protein OrgC [Salmonella enterica subsp. VII serovar 40